MLFKYFKKIIRKHNIVGAKTMNNPVRTMYVIDSEALIFVEEKSNKQ